MLYISDYGPIVTKKNMATPFVSNLLSLIESQSTIHGTIARLARDIESFSTPHQGELQNLVDQQRELKETSDRLAKKDSKRHVHPSAKESGNSSSPQASSARSVP